ncbi:hypothetical protein HYT95_02145 [Candidatus Peregrinibacteria bacterium]|nr:hypothetical protein [Candidatus Peregrinibacteria bacterium]
MLLFRWTSAGLVCSGGPKSFAVFPCSTVEADLTFLSVPEEEVREGRISWPGEYDIAGMAIRGIGQNEGQQVSYVVSLHDIRCAFLSSPLGEWSEEASAQLGNIDLLVLPGEHAKGGSATPLPPSVKGWHRSGGAEGLRGGGERTRD